MWPVEIDVGMYDNDWGVAQSGTEPYCYRWVTETFDGVTGRHRQLCNI